MEYDRFVDGGIDVAEGRRIENDLRGGWTVMNESESSSSGGALDGRDDTNESDPSGSVRAASHRSPSGTTISTVGFG